MYMSAAVSCPDLWLSDHIPVARYMLLKYFCLFFFRKRNLSGLYHLRRSIKFRSANKGEESSTDGITWDVVHCFATASLLVGNNRELFNYFV